MTARAAAGCARRLLLDDAWAHLAGREPVELAVYVSMSISGSTLNAWPPFWGVTTIDALKK